MGQGGGNLTISNRPISPGCGVAVSGMTWMEMLGRPAMSSRCRNCSRITEEDGAKRWWRAASWMTAHSLSGPSGRAVSTAWRVRRTSAKACTSSGVRVIAVAVMISRAYAPVCRSPGMRFGVQMWVDSASDSRVR